MFVGASCVWVSLCLSRLPQYLHGLVAVCKVVDDGERLLEA